MATVASTARLTARLGRRNAFLKYSQRRAFRACTQQLEAQNYLMPALSPTMSEGNIASWQIKEGDSFQAGDVILEVETDKATMDVEAQDDGVLFKIMHGDGAKGVKVGERIAVLAEPDDDLQSLEIPPEDRSKIMSQPSQQQDESASEEKEQQTSQASAKKDEGSQKQAESSTSGSPTKEESTISTTSKPQKYTSTLLPAVVQLLHQNGYHDEEAGKITPTGPNGRILKGDVLAYLGRISKDYPAQESKRLEKQAHLDLSNITPAKPKPADTQQQEKKSTAPEPSLATETEIAVPISLAAVLATQKRVQDSLGIFLPLSTFIARASELANEDLPARKNRTPTSDELFNSVLGLTNVSHKSKSSRGHFIPQITGISPPVPAVPVRKPDIIDMLAPRSIKGPVPKIPVVPPPVGISADGNVFSVTARSGDEARAAEYLERMKLALEKEPGRLVL